MPPSTTRKESSGIDADREGAFGATTKLTPAKHRTTFQVPVRIDDAGTDYSLRLYALALQDDDRGFDPEGEASWTSDRFMDFALFHVVDRAFDRLVGTRPRE